jgi:peptidoglycan/xylan/chitin deacetylase (PgdA/CDA1 family)
MNRAYKIKKLITYFYKQFNRIEKNQNNFRTLMYHSIVQDKVSNVNKNIWELQLTIFKDQIKFITENKKFKIYKIYELLNKIPNNGLCITFDDGYKNNFEFATPILIEKNIPFTIFIITDYIKNSKNRYLNKSMLKELSSNSIVTIGSHSRNHYDLTKLSEKNLEEELEYSKSYLEDLIGKEIYAMSYPYGKYNDRVKDKVKKTGYKLAFTSDFNKNFKEQNKINLSRNEIWNTDTIKVFNEKLNGDWDWLKYRNL